MADTSLSFVSAEDLEAVVHLLRECGLPYHDIGQHLSGMIVAKHDGRLVGTIALEVYKEFGLLRSLAVAPEHRSRGLGRALYGRIVAYAHLRGVTALYLLTTTAAEYFLKLGFQVLDRAQVPTEISATEEFRNLCPSTAVCLAKKVYGDVARVEPGLS